MDNEFRSSVERNRSSSEDGSKTKSTPSNVATDNIIDLLSGGKSVSE